MSRRASSASKGACKAKATRNDGANTLICRIYDLVESFYIGYCCVQSKALYLLSFTSAFVIDEPGSLQEHGLLTASRFKTKSLPVITISHTY